MLRVTDADRRLSDAIDGLTDGDVRRATRLPGWSVGHVLTHLARNCDSHVRRVEAAVRGEVIDQYEGGAEGREDEIERGSRRSAAELIEDVRTSALALERSWGGIPPAAWLGRSRDSGGQVRFLFELPSRRWQEVEVHLVDLEVGVSHADWPDDFVVEWLPRTRERLWPRLTPATGIPSFEVPADELAWLYGRLWVNGVPPPPAWG
jgi:maleylpyruvate isomerase